MDTGIIGGFASDEKELAKMPSPWGFCLYSLYVKIGIYSAVGGRLSNFPVIYPHCNAIILRFLTISLRLSINVHIPAGKIAHKPRCILRVDNAISIDIECSFYYFNIPPRKVSHEASYVL